MSDSIELYESTLTDFLRDSRRRTLLLKGEWGTGKTYFYQEFIRQFEAKTKKPCCYVSLFGVGSLEELKAQIIASSGKLRSSLAAVVNILDRSLKKLKVSLSVPAIAMDALERQLLKDCVVCLDDVERKHPNLRLDAVLGLVDRLATQRLCHVVLILHDGELAGEEEVLKRYRDKVIDIELSFDPSLERNLRVVFGAGVDSDEVSEIRCVLQRLSKKNIRTIKRIRWMLDDFGFLVSSQPRPIRLQLVRQMATHSVLHFEFGSHIDPARFQGAHWLAMKVAERLNQGSHNSDETDKAPDKMVELLYEVEYVAHDLDQLFLQYLKDGYIREALCKPIVDAWKANRARQEVRDETERLQKLAWGGYSVPQDVFETEALHFLDRQLSNLSTEEYNSLVSLLVKLNPKFVRQTWDDKFVEKKIPSASFEELESYKTLTLSSSAMAKVTEKKEQLGKGEGIEQLLQRVCRGDSWHTRDFLFLNSYSEEELMQYFASPEHADSIVELSILSERVGPNSGSHSIELAQKLMSIVKVFSARSRLDEMRAEKAIRNLENFLGRASQQPGGPQLVAN